MERLPRFTGPTQPRPQRSVYEGIIDVQRTETSVESAEDGSLAAMLQRRGQSAARDQSSVPKGPRPQYELSSSNVGWQMLQRQGWEAGTGLGQREGVLTPLESSNKFDRRGLGAAQPEMKPREVPRPSEKARDVRARASREAQERRDLLAYMKR